LTEVLIVDLDVELPEEALDRIAQVFARGVLDHPPDLLPGVREALDDLSGTRQLALISDTAFSPGAILRELMEREGIARYFDAFVFSDETGVAKPDPVAFERALAALKVEPAAAAHIGDIERTDIAGAHAAGMHAILYRNDEHLHVMAEDETVAHVTVEHWAEVAPALERLATRAP
jgi:putative hydrolase of the HAD superfamily